MHKIVIFSFLLLDVIKSLYDCDSEYKKLLQVHGFVNNENREQIFHENCKLINVHNSQIATNDPDALILKLNKLAFYTREEYKNLLKYKNNNNLKKNQTEIMTKCSYKSRNVNWVNFGAVAPIKDQRNCGSCWAFSAVSAVESANYISKRQMVFLSEQELVDCVQGESHGCDGGEMSEAFDYIIKYGLREGSEYPYRAKNGHCRHFNSSTPSVSIKKYCKILPHDNDCLLNAVEKFGPVSIAIDASDDKFRFYGSGVIKCSSSETNLDHGVVIVGYHKGFFSSGSYYIVRNSWGTEWGLDGYFNLSMSEDSNCGATLESSFPMVDDQPCVGN